MTTWPRVKLAALVNEWLEAGNAAEGRRSDLLALCKAAAAIGAEQEREACAQVADVEATRSEFASQARIIAAGIRDRSNP
jgi:hypothetical protein